MAQAGGNTTKAKASWNRRVMRAVFPSPDEPCNCVITRLDLFIHLRLHVSPDPLQTSNYGLWNDLVLLAAQITYLAKLQAPGIASRKWSTISVWENSFFGLFLSGTFMSKQKYKQIGKIQLQHSLNISMTALQANMRAR